MKQNLMWFVCATMLIATSVLVAQEEGSSDGRDDGPMRGPERGMMQQRRMRGTRQEMRMKIMHELKLTDEQKKEVQKLRYELGKQLIAIRGKIALARLDYRQLVSADNPDKAAIEKKLTELSQYGSQVRSMLLDQWFAVNKLLNANQQKVWKRVLERAGTMGRRGMRGPTEM